MNGKMFVSRKISVFRNVPEMELEREILIKLNSDHRRCLVFLGADERKK